MSPSKSEFSGQPADRQGQKPIMTTTTRTMTPGLRGAGSIMDIAVSAASPEGLPIGLLPLYKIVHGLILKKGRYDISSLTAKAVIAVGAVIGIKLAWDFVGPKLVDTLTTSVTIPVEHQKAKDIQSWLESRPSSSASRHTKFRVGALKFNKATQTHQLGGERQAATGGGWYLFSGQPLYIQYIEQPKAEPQNGNAPVTRVWATDNNEPGVDVSGDTIRVFSLGFSNVLDRFLEHVSGRQKVATKDTTVVFEVTPRSGSERRRYGGEDWSKRIRPARPLSTIDLDQEVKDDLVNDIERFLQPKREKWYGCRGIPYRRGYLLYGEPGTGKSSMSAAIAAKVGGNLYQASMNEIADEAHLRRLFTSPEKGDVLLLEDIDSAGISREKMKVQVEEVKEGSKDDKSIESVKTVEPRRGNISLSGLLNAIDGLPDGVILIMTSNTPETLDKALIRPGRIDKQVLFGHVNEAVTECIFKRMFQDDEDDASPNTEVDDLAKTFASRIPENKLTPAEVQGFLIPRATPEQALADVDQWVEELLEAKANGKNIVGVEGEFMDSRQSRNHHKSDDEDSGVDGFSNDSEYDDY